MQCRRTLVGGGDTHSRRECLDHVAQCRLTGLKVGKGQFHQYIGAAVFDRFTGIPAFIGSRKFFQVTLIKDVIQQSLRIKAIGIGDAALVEVADSDNANIGVKSLTQQWGLF